jgi:hypothetical protein
MQDFPESQRPKLSVMMESQNGLIVDLDCKAHGGN